MALTVTAQDPAEDATIDLDANIDFHIGGSPEPLEGTINVTLKIGEAAEFAVIAAGSPQYPFSTSTTVTYSVDGYDISIVNPGSYPPNTQIIVTVNATDGDSLAMTEKVYTLTTTSGDPVRLSRIQTARAS